MISFVLCFCSATIVIAYLMKKHGVSLSEAFQLVKSKRPVISPNAGFMIQLQNYDKTLKGTAFCSLGGFTRMI